MDNRTKVWLAHPGADPATISFARWQRKMWRERGGCVAPEADAKRYPRERKDKGGRTG